MYKIEIISFDLRNEESITKAINSLDYLQVAIENTFDKIDKRISYNDEKIQYFHSRIITINNKIGKIYKANKAIKILAPSNFPGATVLGNISATFGVVPGHFYEMILDHTFADSQAQLQNTFQNKLVFFHVTNQRKKYMLDNVIFKKYDVHFISNHLKFVNSVLLFKLFQHIYDIKHLSRKYFLKDNKPKIDCDIVAAPTSFINRQVSDKYNIDLYMPKLYGAPQINSPIDLPNLPGIAEDIQFVSKEEHEIAPSLFIEKPIHTKMDITPMVSSSALLMIKPNTTYDNVRKDRVRIAPFLPLLPSLPVLHKMPHVNPSSILQQKPDSRAILMDAIRKAGGKLRGVTEPEMKMLMEDEKNTGNKLLNDLHTKLLMRRKGISGTKFKNESVIQQLSDLMPPPQASEKDSSSDTTDNDDWE